MNLKIKLKELLNNEKIIYILILLTSFFITKRGGDTRYIFMNIIIIYSIVHSFLEKNNKQKNNIMKLAFLYLFFLELSVYKVPYFEKISSEFYNFSIYGIILFLAISNINLSNNKLKKVLNYTVIFSLLRLGKGIIEFYKNMGISNYRVTGGLYTTVYSMEISIYLIIVVALLLYEKKWQYKIFYAIYIFFGMVLMIGMKSRTMLLMLPITYALILAIYNIKYLKYLFGILIMIGFVFTFPNKQIERFKSRINSTITIEKIKNDPRIKIYEKFEPIMKESFMNKKGFAYYRVNNLDTGVERVPHLHNTFVEIFVTQGVIASVLYILFQASILFNLLKKYFLQKEVQVLVGIGVILFINLVSLIDTPIYEFKVNNLEYFILGLSLINFEKRS